MYFNIQKQWIIISMMLEGHCREDTNASPFHNLANNFSEKIISQSNYYCCYIYLKLTCLDNVSSFSLLSGERPRNDDS